MKSQAAVLWGLNEAWKIDEIEVDPPKAGEVLVQWRAAGLCHSDEHVRTGDVIPPADVLAELGMTTVFPTVGGHEGAGVVVEVGPGVTSVVPGDHVAALFIPACGQCPSCCNGRQNLCDNGARTIVPGMISDGTHRHHLNGRPVNMTAKIGTFSEFACMTELSIVKVDEDLPFECVALVSCGVATGWGSATRRASVRPGDNVVVVGVGGIGMNAVQGAAKAGAKRVFAVDPVAFKRDKALEFGATHVFASMEDALPVVRELTWGRMADEVIMCPGVMHGELMALAGTLTAKGGTIVVTAVAPMDQTESSVNLFELAMLNKQIKGTIFGSLNPRVDIPRLLGLYREGQLKLDELITNRYTLSQVNDGYEAMLKGENIRGVVIH